MAVGVKICGLTRPEDAVAVAEAGADFAGLVFHPASPRHVSREVALAIADRLRERVRIVALLVDPSEDKLDEVITAARPDFIQLHGVEPPKRVAEIRASRGIPVIKAVSISEEEDFDCVPAYEAVADMLLFDSKAAAGTRSGGRGHAFDWQLLRNRVINRPWLLAGGLNVRNVADAIATAGAPAVDVSSGVESAPGIKKREAIRSFIEAARATKRATGEPV